MSQPFVIVIFGATGDLAQHKLIPALFSLFRQGILGEDFFVVGFARRKFSDSEYGQMLGEELGHVGTEAWQEFSRHLYYQQGYFDQVEGYSQLIEKLNSFDEKMGACIMRLFYLATPPDNYEPILNFLDSTKLSEGCGQGSSTWTRVIIEKPFGRDLETARNLDKKLAEIFEEKQIFRVDHYLGKETMQNMLAFRFANGIFEPVWNNQYIDHVQITWAEQEGVGRRGKFFEGTGLLRDVMQNHLMQMMATVTMEQPRSFEKEAVREARANAIKAIVCPSEEEIQKQIVRGQYNGYRQEDNVNLDSQTETFVAMKLFVDTDRFSGVPFYLRAGKKMPKEMMEISVVFKQTCHLLFKEYGCPEMGNVLTIRIQPDEGIGLRVIVKKPGGRLALDTAEMQFSYHQHFGNHGVDAYEKILMDIMVGDQMLFNRSDELESSWQLISSVLEEWDREDGVAGFQITDYEQGSWGPQEAGNLIEQDGRKWV